MEHELKLETRFFARVQDGTKTFEIRKNDRDFQVGDTLVLMDYDGEKGQYISYSRPIRAKVVYLTTFAQQDGYCVMGIEIEQEEEQ